MGGKYVECLRFLKSVLARPVKPVVEVDAARFCWNPPEPQSAATLTCDNLRFLLPAEAPLFHTMDAFFPDRSILRDTGGDIESDMGVL